MPLNLEPVRLSEDREAAVSRALSEDRATMSREIAAQLTQPKPQHPSIQASGGPPATIESLFKASTSES